MLLFFYFCLLFGDISIKKVVYIVFAKHKKIGKSQT